MTRRAVRDAGEADAATPQSSSPRPLPGWTRTAERYLMPKFVSSLILYLRDRAIVSFSARVQTDRRVELGRGTVVKSYSVVQTSGGRIHFGRDCAIGCFNFIAAGTADGDIIAGDHVRLGAHVTIMGSTREYRRKDMLITDQGFRDKGIRIGSDVLIGVGATLLDGCEIGDGAVIGAGSVVSGKVPPYAVVFGVPAKVIYWRR